MGLGKDILGKDNICNIVDIWFCIFNYYLFGKSKFLVYMLFVCGLYIGFYVKGVFKGLEVEVRVCDWKICLEGWN